MNEQAVSQNTLDSPTSSQTRKLFSSVQLLRLSSILVIVSSVIALAWYLYGDAFGERINPEEIQPVAIGEAESEEPKSNKTSHSPELRTSKKIPRSAITAGISQDIIDQAEHPLDPLLDMARAGADYIEENVRDYTATIIKRVRWKGRLQQEQFVNCKIRHAICTDDPETSVPFSVYTRFLKPKAGQEAIWMAGCHDDKVIAHGPPGLLNVVTFRLDPEGSLAMNGNRYPIQNIGMLNLILKMIETGERDREAGGCEVKITRNIKIGDARCTRLLILHEEKEEQFDFHRAEIYIDDDRNLPIAYRGFSWPDKPGGKPKLIERYLYTNIKINVGLTDVDFDPANPEYKFPGQ